MPRTRSRRGAGTRRPPALEMARSALAIGSRVGRWVIVGSPRQIVHGQSVRSCVPVRCTCGSGIEKLVRDDQLAAGESKSCGCIERERIAAAAVHAGDIFGYWTVVKVVSRSACLCRCACGSQRRVQTSHLKSGKSKSCRCDGRYAAWRQGAAFGAWTTDSSPCRIGNQWVVRVRCECGEESTLRCNVLASGRSKSCRRCAARMRAASRVIKQIPERATKDRDRKSLKGGEVFHWLRVLKHARTNKHGVNYYDCECLRCGTVKAIRVASIKSGKAKSCGCWQGEVASRVASDSLRRARTNVRQWAYEKDGAVVCWMRSSWEVAFAHYLDAAGLRWTYEPETFKLADGRRYTPDFYVSSQKTFY